MPANFTWDDMDYWRSVEWQVVTERLDEFDHLYDLYNPKRELMFAALDATPFGEVKVVLVGQDPYPDRHLACGLAFSAPNGAVGAGVQLPPTLDNIFKELNNDLHIPYAGRTDLLPWANRGVLLWNAIPTCKWRESLSHDWCEYVPLTTEIVQRLSDKGSIVFVFLGGVARRYAHVVDTSINANTGLPKNFVIELSHPVPRASRRSTSPFTGSRMFSTINSRLCDLGITPIDWRL